MKLGERPAWPRNLSRGARLGYAARASLLMVGAGISAAVFYAKAADDQGVWWILACAAAATVAAATFLRIVWIVKE
jgi:hypothetical protein